MSLALPQWSDKPCAPHLIPQNGAHVWTQQELKERLFQEIICYLDKGKVRARPPPACGRGRGGERIRSGPHSCLSPPQMWEKAIELGKQLARMHESHMFDFVELSELLVRGHAHASDHAQSCDHAHSAIIYKRLLCPRAEKTSPVL